ncbi:protein takeout-like [Bradysia coprophila]|uniref:protein takeout-like n=1 Tax=Bradysia coprophila TaxID=38358 RepID=UPI00187D8424|nr:protein takeout-like [Bradysia coprophila]
MINSLFGHSSGAEYLETKPAFLRTCQRKSPDEVFVPCSTETIQSLFQNLSTGFDGLDIKIDPIKLREIKIFSSDGPVSLNTSLSNGVVKGLSNSIVVRSYINPVDYSWDSNIRIPKLRLEGNYEMGGRILLLPLQGRGKCWIEPQNLDIKIHADAKVYEKFGHLFYNITKAQIDFTMSGLRLQLDNLFNGIKLLEDSTNAFLNENWRPVSDAFKPLIKKTIEDIVIEVINKIFNFVPAEYLVSDIPHPSELYKESKKDN